MEAANIIDDFINDEIVVDVWFVNLKKKVAGWIVAYRNTQKIEIPDA
jgi:hypothetical protein